MKTKKHKNITQTKSFRKISRAALSSSSLNEQKKSIRKAAKLSGTFCKPFRQISFANSKLAMQINKMVMETEKCEKNSVRRRSNLMKQFLFNTAVFFVFVLSFVRVLHDYLDNY